MGRAYPTGVCASRATLGPFAFMGNAMVRIVCPISIDPEFLAVYGRRRIGKTYLISEFFKRRGVYFEISR
jgi:hypothetical protein